MLKQNLNAIYSVFSYGCRRSAGIYLSPPLPPAISLEISSKCNLSCPECVTGAGLLKRQSSFIDFSLAEKAAHELHGTVISAWLFGQGEPMLHPRFFEIIELYSMMNPVISTNGHFLDEENCMRLARSGLRRIIIPYDGISEEVYGIYRKGGDHRRVTEGIRSLARVIRKTNSSVRLEIQFLIHRHNEHELAGVAAFARSVGARFRIKSMQVLDTARAGEWMPSDSRKARYKKSDGTWKASRSQSKGCVRMWTSAVINVDGDVVPCCFDKHGCHAMGNIKNKTFREIWQSPEYNLFRSAVMKNRNDADICSHCPEGRTLLFRK